MALLNQFSSFTSSVLPSLMDYSHWQASMPFNSAHLISWVLTAHPLLVTAFLLCSSFQLNPWKTCLYSFAPISSLHFLLILLFSGFIPTASAKQSCQSHQWPPVAKPSGLISVITFHWLNSSAWFSQSAFPAWRLSSVWLGHHILLLVASYLLTQSLWWFGFILRHDDIECPRTPSLDLFLLIYTSLCGWMSIIALNCPP